VRQSVVSVRDQAPFALVTDRALRAEVTSGARCADGMLDPDEWFPVSTDAEAARREAAGAIAVCGACPVRDACLELSVRHWRIGQHGVWGGLVPAERAAVRRRRLTSARRNGHALSVANRTGDGHPRPPARHLVGGDLARMGSRSGPSSCAPVSVRRLLRGKHPDFTAALKSLRGSFGVMRTGAIGENRMPATSGV
jgi:hypothetical protein